MGCTLKKMSCVHASARLINEDADHVTVKVELAGMKKEDFEISLEDCALTVSGKREYKRETSRRSVDKSREGEAPFEP
jgi:HSP20 family molecular chaperone IbpA